MKIDFYCEFPNKKNLAKLKLINFPSMIFIAAHSLKEFEKIKKQTKNINKKIKVAYWPIIKNSYWISPFSNTGDLLKLFNELKKTNYHLLIDLEPPMLNKKLIIKNIFKFKKNKKIIKEFLEKNKQRITTAQFPFPKPKILKFIGLSYDIKTQISLMYYSSMTPKIILPKIKKNLIKIKNKNNYPIGIGTITKGIFGNEPILSPKELKKDLGFIKKIGFKKVTIFGLSGLNKKYVSVIKDFLN